MTLRAATTATAPRLTQATRAASLASAPPPTPLPPIARGDDDNAPPAAAATPRRSLLAGAALLVAAPFAAPATPPAAAATTARVPAAAGWTLRPPPGWTLAYDRTPDDAASTSTSSSSPAPASGPRVMWANFSTLGTVVVSRATRAELGWPAGALPAAVGGGGGGGGAQDAAIERLLDPLFAEARDSPATYGWRLLATATHNVASSSSSTALQAYDAEYVVQICRGEVLEASGGAKRCANPRDDSDLQIVSRHFVVSAVPDPVEEGVVWVVRGSCPSENWADAGAKIADAVRSLAFGG